MARMDARMDGPTTTNLTLAALGGGTLLVRVGFGWYIGGMARAKNAAGAVLRNLADLAVAVLFFWAIGMAILNGSAGMILDVRNHATSTQFVQLALILIATAPLTGAALERCRFFPMLAAPALLGGFIVPLCGHWAWHGWLQRLGFFDAAVSAVLHVTGGLAAFA